MGAERARIVSSSGEVFSAPFEYLTRRSVFLQGRCKLRFDEPVQLEILGNMLDARVAFVAYEPAGIVLSFDAYPELASKFRRWQQHRRETWSDEDVTSTVEGDDSEILASMMARAETVTMLPRRLDSEEPTNTGENAIDDEDQNVTLIPVTKGPENSSGD